MPLAAQAVFDARQFAAVAFIVMLLLVFAFNHYSD